MYCKGCGKFIGNDSDLCDECLVKKDDFSELFSANNQPNSNFVANVNNEISLKDAIVAIVLSNVGFELIFVAIMLMGQMLFTPTIIVAVIGIVPSVFGLIWGIKTIRYYKSTANVKSKKRIPLLILGIASVALSGLGLFLALITVIISATA